MNKFYYCASCDFSFSQVRTGNEPKAKCPKCHSRPNRKYFKINNTITGLSVEEIKA